MTNNLLPMIICCCTTFAAAGETNIALTSPAYSVHRANGGYAHPIRAVDGSVDTAWNAGRGAVPDDPVDLRIEVGDGCIVRNVRSTIAKSDFSRGSYVCKLYNSEGILIDARHVSRVVGDGATMDFDFGQQIANVASVVISCEISGASWVSWREIEVFGSKPLRESNLTYFGYYFGVWSGTNYITELRTSNVVQIEVGVPGLRSTLEQLRRENKKALVYIWHYFKELPVSRRQWDQAVPTLERYKDQIAAFVTKDEPGTGRVPWGNDRLEEIAGVVKSDFPDIPLAVNFAAPTVRRAAFSIPRKHDWVSFDFYIDQGARRFSDVLSVYRKLEEKMQPNHRFYVTADGSRRRANATLEGQHEAAVRGREYYNWSVRNSRVVAFVPWHWQPAADGFLGAKSLPTLRFHLDIIAKAITESLSSHAEHDTRSDRVKRKTKNGRAAANDIVPKLKRLDEWLNSGPARVLDALDGKNRR